MIDGIKPINQPDEKNSVLPGLPDRKGLLKGREVIEEEKEEKIANLAADLLASPPDNAPRLGKLAFTDSVNERYDGIVQDLLSNDQNTKPYTFGEAFLSGVHLKSFALTEPITHEDLMSLLNACPNIEKLALNAAFMTRESIDAIRKLGLKELCLTNCPVIPAFGFVGLFLSSGIQKVTINVSKEAEAALRQSKSIGLKYEFKTNNNNFFEFNLKPPAQILEADYHLEVSNLPIKEKLIYAKLAGEDLTYFSFDDGRGFSSLTNNDLKTLVDQCPNIKEILLFTSNINDLSPLNSLKNLQKIKLIAIGLDIVKQFLQSSPEKWLYDMSQVDNYLNKFIVIPRCFGSIIKA